MFFIDLPFRERHHVNDLFVGRKTTSLDIVLRSRRAEIDLGIDTLTSRGDVDPSVAEMPSSEMILAAKETLLRAYKMVEAAEVNTVLSSAVGKAVLQAFSSVKNGVELGSEPATASAVMSAFLAENGLSLGEKEVNLALTLYTHCLDAMVLSQTATDTFVQKYAQVNAGMSMREAKADVSGQKAVSAAWTGYLHSKAHAVMDMNAEVGAANGMEISTSAVSTTLMTLRKMHDVDSISGAPATLESLDSMSLYDIDYIKK